MDSYRRLAEVFHHVLSEHDLDAVLERIADALADLIPHDTLTIYRAQERERLLVPVLARDQWAEAILNTQTPFGEGLTGWTAENRQPVLANRAHEDPRAIPIPGTPDEPEALISVPLVSKDSVKGVLNIYRVGEAASFTDEEFGLVQRFGDAAALALDNAESRAALERQSHTDSLTNLYNHRFFQERLRAELTRATRAHDSIALAMLDIDDFKRINDVHGHGVGDHILVTISEILKDMIRGSDVPCRIGGEEFALIMPSCDAADAVGFVRRLTDRLNATDFDPVGRVTVSVGIAEGPRDAANPRELLARAETAMMTVKARGKDGVLIYRPGQTERPVADRGHSEVRSIAHLKMLQSLAGKLNRLNDVVEIGTAIANELRTLIDYHCCRVYVADGSSLRPIAVKGEVPTYEGETSEVLLCEIGEGITGRAAETRRSVLVSNALECEFAEQIPGSDDVEESIVAVPLLYGARTLGVIAITKLGTEQFDGDDVRLVEVLAGHASVALENARLYEAQRKEAESAKALLECADIMAKAPSSNAIANETVNATAQLLEAPQSSLWLLHDQSGEFRCVAHHGYVGEPGAEPIIRQTISGDDGRQFLRGRKLPFIVRSTDMSLHLPVPEGAALRDCAIAPLHGLDGWIVAAQPPQVRNHFTEQRLRMLAGISYQTSVAVQKADFYKRQRENAEIANALLEFGRQLTAVDDMDQVLARIAEQSARILGSPKTSVWLQDLDTKEMRVVAAWGYEEDGYQKLRRARFSKDTATPFAARVEPFVMRAQEAAAIEGTAGLIESSTYAIAPLRIEGGRLGFIVAGAPALGDYEFSSRKMRLLAGIAHQSTLAINSGSSFENLERTFFDTVEALANALEARDEYTSSHARWITDTSLEVGRAIGLDQAALKRLELGALFHDIGKIGISNEILQKPGPLTEDEWRIMKMHPEMGERILAPIERLGDVRPIVRACHEHYDGSGYPDGKAGDDIPIESRVILVVDAFHAMMTDRPYRKGLSYDESCRRLRESSGRQFDPQVVDTLLWLFEERPELTEVS
ncbi:MAG: GAF domain-containing protein [Actinomycetota bacterium]|nr:GAF domain-containing protein [Actinomycetota bacterium]